METLSIGNENFKFTIQSNEVQGNLVHDFCIYEAEANNEYEFFEFQVTCLPDNFNIVTNMHNNNYPSVSGKGIAAYMIEYVSHFVNGKLYSSSNNKKRLDNEFISISAEKVWKRLVAEGKALFICHEDRFLFIK